MSSKQTKADVSLNKSVGGLLGRTGCANPKGLDQKVSARGAGLDFRHCGTSTKFLEVKQIKLHVILGADSELRQTVLRNRFDTC